MSKPSWYYRPYYTEEQLVQKTIVLIDWHHYTDEEIENELWYIARVPCVKARTIIGLAKIQLGVADLF